MGHAFRVHSCHDHADTRPRYPSWTLSHCHRAGGVLGRQPSANLQTDRNGALWTIRFGVRYYRIPTRSALAFERRVQVDNQNPLGTPAPVTQMPRKIGLQRRVPRAAD